MTSEFQDNGYLVRQLNKANIRKVFVGKISCLQVRASHYSGVLSTSFMFTRTAVTSNAFEICRNVRYCCPRKYETWRQYPLIISDKKLANCYSPYFFFGQTCEVLTLKTPSSHLKLVSSLYEGNDFKLC